MGTFPHTAIRDSIARRKAAEAKERAVNKPFRDMLTKRLPREVRAFARERHILDHLMSDGDVYVSVYFFDDEEEAFKSADDVRRAAADIEAAWAPYVIIRVAEPLYSCMNVRFTAADT